MFKVRLLEEISAWEVIFIPVTTGKKGEFMIDEGKKHLDREIPEDSLKVFGLVFEKRYWKMFYFNQTFLFFYTKLYILYISRRIFWTICLHSPHKGQRNLLF